MLTLEETRFALEDARHRQVALLNLIYAIERQAGMLLRLYVTLSLAAALLSSSGAVLIPIISGLLSAVAVLLIGAGFCFRAMKSANIGLPGRGADYWLWALDPAINFAEAAKHYLSNLSKKQERDQELNRSTAGALSWAKKLGILSPVIAVVAAGIAYWIVK